MNRPFCQAVRPEVALFADAWLWWGNDLKILGFDFGDNGVEVAACLIHQFWSIRELHQRVLLARLGGPVQEQAVRPFAVALLEDMGVGAELTFVGCEEFGRVSASVRS